MTEAPQGLAVRAPGWASAYQAAKYLKQATQEAQSRNLPLTNPFPIVKG